jgi:hypothetical protein
MNAQILRVSRDWKLAKVWLPRELSGGAADGG